MKKHKKHMLQNLLNKNWENGRNFMVAYHAVSAFTLRKNARLFRYI